MTSEYIKYTLQHTEIIYTMIKTYKENIIIINNDRYTIEDISIEDKDKDSTV